MRDDEDNIRQYLPVLRRIIILVAVLTAIPVVMWTITAFVRSHIGPPHAPDLRPMAIAPASPPANTTIATVSDQSPAQSVNTAQTVPSNAPADAATKDGGRMVSAPADATPTGATPAFKTASVAPSNATPEDATPAASISAGNGAANSTDSAAPEQSSDISATQVAARPQDAKPRESVWPAQPAAAAGALPPGEPISGPVPLPRKRPTSFAMAGNVPMPAPRPQAAGAGAADSSPTAADWLKKVFHPSTAPVQSSDSGDTAHE